MYTVLALIVIGRSRYWEGIDMLRKLSLVGLVLLVGRGSIAQLSAAIAIAFGFFAMQIKTWPCESQIRPSVYLILYDCLLLFLA
jgi:hypothetical protein